MIRKVITITLALWGWACLSVMFYYTALFFINPHYSWHSEYWQGAAWFWMFGLLTWVLQPILSIVWRKNLSRIFLTVVNAPVFIAFFYFGCYWFAVWLLD